MDTARSRSRVPRRVSSRDGTIEAAGAGVAVAVLPEGVVLRGAPRALSNARVVFVGLRAGPATVRVDVEDATGLKDSASTSFQVRPRAASPSSTTTLRPGGIVRATVGAPASLEDAFRASGDASILTVVADHGAFAGRDLRTPSVHWSASTVRSGAKEDEDLRELKGALDSLRFQLLLLRRIALIG